LFKVFTGVEYVDVELVGVGKAMAKTKPAEKKKLIVKNQAAKYPAAAAAVSRGKETKAVLKKKGCGKEKGHCKEELEEGMEAD